jgi:hypothetical protein
MKTIALTLMLGMIAPGLHVRDWMMSTTDMRESAAEAAFNWTQTTYDFGKIKRNTPVTHEFRFINNGNDPLIITSVKASCGCTVAEYTKDPVAPGAEGFVKATYNAATEGAFTKTITVNSNTSDGVVTLIIKGEVNN